MSSQRLLSLKSYFFKNQESLKVMSKIVSSAQELHEAGLPLLRHSNHLLTSVKTQAAPFLMVLSFDIQVLIAPVNQPIF